MSSAAVEALRAELMVARGPLLLQIQGFIYLSTDPGMSPEALAVLDAESTEHQARKTAIDNVLVALDELNANGYPDSMASAVPQSVMTELDAHDASVDAAIAELSAAVEAASATIVPGEPVEK